VDAVAHREDGVDLPVDDVGGGVGRVGRDHGVMGCVEGLAGGKDRSQQEEDGSAGHGQPVTLGHGEASVGGTGWPILRGSPDTYSPTPSDSCKRKKEI